MKKIVFISIITAFALIFATTCLAQNKEDTSEETGHMMSGQEMMEGHGMMGQGMNQNQQWKGHCPMAKGTMGGMANCTMMGKAMVSTEDGGVVVMIGNKLYRYDKNLELTKEAELKTNCEKKMK